MRKALLLIKVVLLLTAMTGQSNAQAADSGSMNFLAASICDFNTFYNNQQYGDDDAATSSEYHFVLSRAAHFLPSDYTSLSARLFSARPFARAPPAHL